MSLLLLFPQAVATPGFQCWTAVPRVSAAVVEAPTWGDLEAYTWEQLAVYTWAQLEDAATQQVWLTITMIKCIGV